MYKKEIKKLHLLYSGTCFLGRIFLNIRVYPPDKRKRDIDNLIKVVADSLQDAGFYENDSQIDRIFIERDSTVVKNGELCVRLSEIK